MTHDLVLAIKTGGHRDSKSRGFSCCTVIVMECFSIILPVSYEE